MTIRPCRSWTCLFAMAILPCACAGRDADARIAKAVQLVAVESATGGGATTYSAVIAPNAQVDLAFRVAGYVVEVRRSKAGDGQVRELEPGALVQRGATLARIRPTDYQAVVDKAHGGREEAIAGVTVAEASLAEAEASFAQAEFDFGRISTLWQQESVTKPAYDSAKARLDAARAKVDAATAGIAAAKQRAASAGAQLHEAEIALSDTELRAPFDAILLDRRVDIGTLVSPGTPAFTIADLHQIKARFSAPDTALHLFRPGQMLSLTVDAFPSERLVGRVLSVAPSADPKSRSFEIVVAIDNPALRLRSGMIASIRVDGDGADSHQLWIPIDALVHDPIRDQYLVYGLEQKDGRTVAKAMSIRPGPLVGNHVSVLDGLTAGQRIVASGANLLRPGDAVREVQ
jgi:multidrug efflux pump subunit AcrA (membrane-fusion protein)